MRSSGAFIRCLRVRCTVCVMPLPACPVSTPRRIWSSSIDLEQRPEVAFAEALVALALDELEEDRPELGLREDLQQQSFGARCWPVDQDVQAPAARRGSRRGPGCAC